MTPRLPAPLPWLAGLLVIYLLLPFIAAIPQVWLADWRSVDMAALGRASAVSVGSATLASALIALGGIPLGYLLARVPGRAVAALGFLVQLPLALPPLASGILLLFLLGYRSPLGRLTDGGLTDSFLGIVLAEMFVAAPFLIIAARSAFAAVDPVLEGVAATLGHGRLATFLRVSLPLAWPTTRSGLLLAWLRGFAASRLRRVRGDRYGRLSSLLAADLHLRRLRFPGPSGDAAHAAAGARGGTRRYGPQQCQDTTGINPWHEWSGPANGSIGRAGRLV